MARKRSGGGERGRGGVASLAILSPSSFSCHFVPVITPKMVAGLCDLLRGRGGQTGTGGVGGEEDYGIEEAASYFPFCWWRPCWAATGAGRRRGGGVAKERQGCCPSHVEGQIHPTRGCEASACQTKCLYCASATKKTKHPLMVCLCFFCFFNIVIYMCLIYAAHVREHTCAHA